MEDKKMDVWIITSNDLGNRPIIVSSSQKEATQQLFDYMGYEGKDNDRIIYNGFNEIKHHEEENERSCIGTFTFETLFAQKWETDKYHLYELTLNQNQKLGSL